VLERGRFVEAIGFQLVGDGVAVPLDDDESDDDDAESDDDPIFRLSLTWRTSDR
jgi:hypothetical protein